MTKTIKNINSQDAISTKNLWAQFYTSDRVGELLVNAIGSHRPRSLIDLGCGLGALSRAASKRWKNVSIVSVDIDTDTQKHSAINQTTEGASHRHVSGDALSEAIFDQVMRGREHGFDAVLSNPPYLRPKWRPCFEKIIDGAGLANVTAIQANASTDVLFLAQALRLIRQGGIAGFIVPEGLIAGSKSERLRDFLINNHQITNILSLPSNSFKDADVKTHLLILQKGASETGYKIRLRSLNCYGKLTSPITINMQDGVKRLDYEFHNNTLKMKKSKYSSLRELGAQIHRGIVSSIEHKSSRQSALHTTNFHLAKSGNIIYEQTSIDLLSFDTEALAGGNSVQAQAGDIVVARVGRNLQDKVALVASGRITISDCVYRVRAPQSMQLAIAAELASSEGRRWLKAVSHGAGAAHLTKAELFEFPISKLTKS